MDLGLREKVAIVTGSSDGIGFTVAHLLAVEGARVVVCARREAKLQEARDRIVKETGAEVLAVQCDVRRLDDVQRLVGDTLQRFGAIHILINNAGSVPSIKFTDVSDAQWYEYLERKLMGFLRVSREVVPHVQKAGWGRIINVAGTAGWEPSNTGMAVGLNNAAVMNWTKSMSLQYASDGILVNTVAPGSIDTPRQVANRQRESEVTGRSVEELRKARVKDIPLGRLGRPDEVANLIVFLASECSSYVTGTCVTIDGGVVRGI
ncbi:MAG TPA: SDR family oxidoreductase [Candidatus Binatia bacterium]|nr:SDR family oxidoreductase [Candidatus Binatia bacterium]